MEWSGLSDIYQYSSSNGHVYTIKKSLMRFSEALSYGILAGTSIYCCSQTSLTSYPCDSIAYVIVGASATLNLLHAHLNNDYLDSLKTFCEFSETFFAYPLLVSHLWFTYGEPDIAVYAHPPSVLGLHLIGTEILRFEHAPVVVLGYTANQVSCLYLANIYNNYYALAGTAMFLLTELLILFKGVAPIPPAEGVNYGLALMQLFFFYAFKNYDENC